MVAIVTGSDRGTPAPCEEPAPDCRAGLFASLREQIVTGELTVGSKLPAERQLAVQVGLTRTQVRSVLRALEVAGLVTRRVGRTGGTFVAPRPVERVMASSDPIPSLLRGQGFTYASSLVRVGNDRPTLTEQMALPGVERMIEVVRVRLADGTPLSVETARFPLDRFPVLASLPLCGSLYELLASHYGVRPGKVIERITAINADQQVAELLGVAAGSATLCVIRRTHDPQGVPFEFSRDVFRGDRLQGIVTSGSNYS